MLLSGEKATEVFLKIRELKDYMERYCIAPDRACLSIVDMKRCIGEMYDLKIEIEEVAFDGEYVRGLVERYKDGRARILIRSDQPNDWKRFVAAKELCHLVVDGEDDWSTHGTQTIETYLYEAYLTDPEEIADNLAQSEAFAAIAAVEMVYPFEFRNPDAAQIKSKKTTIKQIALHFEIPEFAVSMSLSRKI